jgi:hypothetical protein
MLTKVQRARAARGRQAVRCLWVGAVVLLAAWGAGCLEVKDHLTINPDGSGAIVLEVPQAGKEVTQMAAMGGMAAMYPPVGEQQIRNMFPRPDFVVETKSGKTADGQPTQIAEVSFKDVNKLLASSYGKAHSLTLAIQGDQMVLTARTGMQYVGHLDPLPEGGQVPMPIPMDEVKAALAKARCEFKVTLPSAAKAAGATVDNQTATWTVDRAKLADAAAATAAFDAVLTAQCPAAGVTFKPAVMTRLDLAAFKDLKEEKLGQVTPVDVEKIRAAVKFIPVMFRVTRSFNLSGDAFHGENEAVFTGALILPRAFKPQRWGEPKIEEAKDNLGKSMMLPTGDGNESRWRQQRYQNMMQRDDHEEAMPAEKGKNAEPNPNLTHLVTLGLALPSLAARKMSTLKASVDLVYPGAARIVRLENAVADGAIMNMSGQAQGGSFSSSEKAAIASATLKELGLSLKLNNAMRIGCLTMLELSSEGDKGVVSDVQVFDAQGVPLTTIVMREGFGPSSSNMIRAMVIGATKGPLSLALIVEAGGPSVTVPIAVTNVSLVGDENKPSGPPADGKKGQESENKTPKTASPAAGNDTGQKAAE